MLFFLVCLLLYCNIFNLTGKPITLIIITSSGSVILMTTVAEILQGQIFNSVNQTKQPSHIELLWRYTRWNRVSRTCLRLLLFFRTWSKLYVRLNCAIHFAKVPSQKFREKQMCCCENDSPSTPLMILWTAEVFSLTSGTFQWSEIIWVFTCIFSIHRLSIMSHDIYTCNKFIGTQMHALLGLCTHKMV